MLLYTLIWPFVHLSINLEMGEMCWCACHPFQLIVNAYLNDIMSLIDFDKEQGRMTFVRSFDKSINAAKDRK